jgi:hypothetical protein
LDQDWPDPALPPQPIRGNLKEKCLRILQIGIGRQIAVSLMRRELENL